MKFCHWRSELWSTHPSFSIAFRTDREKKVLQKKILHFLWKWIKIGEMGCKESKNTHCKEISNHKIKYFEQKTILFSFDSTRLLDNKYFINCHSMISKSTVQETIDRIYMMLETPKKNWQMEKIISPFFSLTPTQLYYTHIQKKEIVKCSFNSWTNEYVEVFKKHFLTYNRDTKERESLERTQRNK